MHREASRRRGVNPMSSHQQPAHHCHNCATDAPPAAPQPPHAGSTQYTCPMHPEIVRDAPGSCPICGMALEPRVPTLDAGPDPELVDMTRRFWVAAVLALPLLVVTMGEMFGV